MTARHSRWRTLVLAAGVLAATGPALAAGAAPGASDDAPVLRVIAAGP